MWRSIAWRETRAKRGATKWDTMIEFANASQIHFASHSIVFCFVRVPRHAMDFYTCPIWYIMTMRLRRDVAVPSQVMQMDDSSLPCTVSTCWSNANSSRVPRYSTPLLLLYFFHFFYSIWLFIKSSRCILVNEGKTLYLYVPLRCILTIIWSHNEKGFKGSNV